MIKKYEFKLYTRQWNFKKQINPRVISGNLSFSEQLDWGQGDLNLKIYDKIEDYQTSDIIEIREISEVGLWVSATYTGIIENIGITETREQVVLDIELLGVFTVLWDIYYHDWENNKVFTKTDTIENIINDIISKFNGRYGTLSDTQNLWSNMITTEIEAGTPTVSISFSNHTCLTAIEKVLENTGYNWYVNQYWILYITSKDNQRDITLTFMKEITNIHREITKNEMVNTLFLHRNWWTGIVYEDTPAKALFWPKEKYVSDTAINDVSTQNIKGSEYIEKHKYEKITAKIDMKPQMSGICIITKPSLEIDLIQYLDPTAIDPTAIWLMPWDKISTMNTKNMIESQAILKIDKSIDQWIIYLWDYISFAKEVAMIWQ